MASLLAFIEGIGGPELMMILFIVLLLFGANKLPELARGFGKSMREFKKAASGVEEEFRQAMNEVERRELAEKRPVGALPRPDPSAPKAPTTPAPTASPTDSAMPDDSSPSDLPPSDPTTPPPSSQNDPKD